MARGLYKLQAVMREAQGTKGLTVEEAGMLIEATGGFSYPAGTTLEMILKDMERCKLIKMRGDRVYA
jgi:hypothetical protein